jgi:sporadic carbohydrate cluster 2OG-Fe(II) oxygenase
MNKDILKNYDWTPDPRWDNKILDYDKEKYNWSGWALEIVRELKPTVDSLENIHLFFSNSELITLRKHLEKWTNCKEFSAKLDDFFSDYVSQLIDGVDYMIQSTCGIRIVVPNQEKIGRLLSFHTGYWTGYSNDMGTVWTPLSRSFGTNTMQVMSWNDTVKTMRRIHEEKLSLDELQALCEEQMFPVEIDVGQSWLFNQGHLHGNVNNTTKISRLSFDARYVRIGGDYGPRHAGSFFRFPGQFSMIDKSKIQKGLWVVFVDQNSEFIGNLPHYMVREFLLGISKNLGLEISEWSNEYWGCTWMPKLQDYTNKTTLSGMIFPSIHAFSGDIESRFRMFSNAINNGQQLIFVDENLLITNHKELEFVDRIYQVS